jgi:hypothetical protein
VNKSNNLDLYSMTVIPHDTIAGSQQAYPAMTAGTARTTIDYLRNIRLFTPDID